MIETLARPSLKNMPHSNTSSAKPSYITLHKIQQAIDDNAMTAMILAIGIIVYLTLLHCLFERSELSKLLIYFETLSKSS